MPIKMKKSFILTLLMAFVLMAKASSHDPDRLIGTHWTFLPNYEHNLTITGIIILDGESLQNSPRSANLEIGAFCGDECRGSYLADYVSLPFFNGYAYQMQVYSNQASGEQIIFRVYDHEANMELDVTCLSNLQFTANTQHGNLRTPYEFVFYSNYTITTSANPSEGGQVSGGGTYNHFETCTLTATVNEDYTFINWTKNGVVVSTELEFEFTVTEAGTYVANFTPNQFTITASANPSSGGTVTGGGVYNAGASCTLTATAHNGFTFINWTKNGTVVSTNSTYSFTVNENASYVAHFSHQSYEITATADPATGGSVSGAGTYYYGSTCTLTATANNGYNFTGWTKNGNIVSYSPTYSFAVTENAAYVAHFSTTMFLITLSADPTAGGSVYGTGAYSYGDECTILATANSGYTFVNWTKNGTVVSTSSNYTFTVTENAEYVAHFSFNSYVITASANPEIGGTVTGGGTYAHGTTCNLVATPNEGYSFVNWTKNGSVVSSQANYSFTVTEGGNYVANFEVSTYVITVTPEPAEGGTTIGSGTYQYGALCTMRATANEGYTFAYWSKDGVQVSTNPIYHIIVREDASYKAHFDAESFEITAAVTPQGSGIITGTGSYNYGETCTLTVTPNTDYVFVNWTENGEIVSVEETFEFIVTDNHHFVANLEYIEGVDENNGITFGVYPNPVINTLTVEISESVDLFEIYTITGELVFKQTDCSEKMVIDVHDLSNGIYMIRLTNGNSIATQRFVKSR